MTINTEHKPRRLAVIQTAGPDQAAAREALDLVLNAAALDIDVQLILCGPALFNLCQSASSVNTAFGIKGIKKKYAMLELYDVPAPWVLDSELEQLTQAQGDQQDFAAYQVIPHATLYDRLAAFDHVLRF